jgi:hypothetical protein
VLSASCWVVALLVMRPWRWRRHIPPKRLLNFNGLHRVISKNSSELSLWRTEIIHRNGACGYLEAKRWHFVDFRMMWTKYDWNRVGFIVHMFSFSRSALFHRVYCTEIIYVSFHSNFCVLCVMSSLFLMISTYCLTQSTPSRGTLKYIQSPLSAFCKKGTLL